LSISQEVFFFDFHYTDDIILPIFLFPNEARVAGKRANEEIKGSLCVPFIIWCRNLRYQTFPFILW